MPNKIGNGTKFGRNIIKLLLVYLVTGREDTRDSHQDCKEKKPGTEHSGAPGRKKPS
jgi:hypothetical protein